MQKKNKYKYLKIIQALIPDYGWSDYTAYDKNDAEQIKSLKYDLKLYRENEPYLFRVISRRLPADVKFHA